MPHCMNFSLLYLYTLTIKETSMHPSRTLLVHRMSGRTVPGDTGVVRGEALRDALDQFLGPLVCGMGAVILISY